ncbi:MAG: hypothetical protein ACTSUD_11345 [Alphaproteobacteria bacterium]
MEFNAAEIPVPQKSRCRRKPGAAENQGATGNPVRQEIQSATEAEAGKVSETRATARRRGAGSTGFGRE